MRLCEGQVHNVVVLLVPARQHYAHAYAEFGCTRGAEEQTWYHLSYVCDGLGDEAGLLLELHAVTASLLPGLTGDLQAPARHSNSFQNLTHFCGFLSQPFIER